jgi:opacity protein-like surface antigen
MGKFKGIAVMIVLVMASSAWAQVLMPKTEISGGYTYGSLDQNAAGRMNSNGWNTGATTFVNRWLGVEGNIAGLTNSQSFTDAVSGVSASASDKHYTFVFGPRFTFGQGRVNPFVHTLFGLDRETLSFSGTTPAGTLTASGSDNAFASALGGGLEYGLTKHFGLVTGSDYLLTRHGSATQNNFRVQVGMSVRFGQGWSGSKQ